MKEQKKAAGSSTDAFRVNSEGTQVRIETGRSTGLYKQRGVYIHPSRYLRWPSETVWYESSAVSVVGNINESVRWRGDKRK